MLEQVYKEAHAKMDGAIHKLAKELAKVRTGRASLSMFDGVTVDYYGQATPISQVAGISNPEPNMITIQPWDTTLLAGLEKAILAANLGFTPSNDGQMIRISIPPLTEERRKEYAKQAHKFGETAKNAIRNVRREENDGLKAKEKSKELSKDDMQRGLDEIQKITDKKSEAVDKLVSDKEKEIMSF